MNTQNENCAGQAPNPQCVGVPAGAMQAKDYFDCLSIEGKLQHLKQGQQDIANAIGSLHETIHRVERTIRIHQHVNGEVFVPLH